MWSNNATTQNITGLPAGYVHGNCERRGDHAPRSLPCIVPDNPNTRSCRFLSQQHRADWNNGSINLTVIGGVAPYMYQWGSGQVVQDLSNIPAGDYTVTVTGANGCVAVGNAFVPDNAIPISLDGNVTPQTSCVTNNGSIVLILSPNNLTVLGRTAATRLNLTIFRPAPTTLRSAPRHLHRNGKFYGRRCIRSTVSRCIHHARYLRF
ncbi:MAG: SprB repeat-containing protein [Lewinellaceae bacterium]|nr:SprB repeat-containing protein [Lewinellaceae bacterium]